jgi:hypothetical protein
MAKQVTSDEQKRLYRFLEGISKLGAIEFLGIAHLLTVPLAVEGTTQNRDFDDILSDMMDKFVSLSSTKQKELIKLVKKTKNYKGGMTFGNPAEHDPKKK